MNRKELTILALITFITVLVWIVFGIIHANKSSSISDIQSKQVIPLTPTFDDDIINQLKSREE